jgi:malate synthase
MSHQVTISPDSDDAELADLIADVLPPAATAFLADLHSRFNDRRLDLLESRHERDVLLTNGGTLDFLPETAAIREDLTWRVAPAAPGLIDRRVEITGPTDKKMAINALNSGAKVWLADFEDANTPLFANMLGGQANLRDSVLRTLSFQAGDRTYELVDELATVVARPRGWHMIEKHFLVDGVPMSGSLFDFGLYMFHSAALQIEHGKGPYFYLPKMESYLEARLWNDVFLHAQEVLGIPRGTIRATVLIETYPAAFQMEEILYELREHSAGLNAGRWDYLFSVIKKFRTAGRDYLLPDRNAVTMTAPFMRAYTELLVSTCHKRGAHAIGGMAAVIPNRRDAEANTVALAKVSADKTREAGDGFDGSWVAHPDLVPTCKAVFDSVLGERPNQVERLRDDVHVTADQLLDVKSTPGEITEAGLRSNISVGLQYIESWLRGNGAAAIFGLMEDVATAEISRSQVWQWRTLGVVLPTGALVTTELVNQIIGEELQKIHDTIGDDGFATGEWPRATELYRSMATADEFDEFLTSPAYAQLP